MQCVINKTEPPPSESNRGAKVEKLFRRYDKDGSGDIDFHEFLKLIMYAEDLAPEVSYIRYRCPHLRNPYFAPRPSSYLSAGHLLIRSYCTGSYPGISSEPEFLNYSFLKCRRLLWHYFHFVELRTMCLCAHGWGRRPGLLLYSTS